MKRLSEKEFEDRMLEIQPNLTFEKTKYVNRLTKVIVTCPIHGDVTILPARNLSRKVGCPECSKKNLNFFIIDNKLKNNSLEIIKDREYTNNKAVYKFKCLVCGEIFEKRLDSVLNGYGCKKCSGLKKSLMQKNTKEYLVKKIEEKYGKDTYLFNYEDYKKNNIKITFFCKKCNKYFDKRMNDLLNGSGCPNCSESYENKFENILEEKNVLYEKNKTYENLIDRKKLSYDFYLPEYNLLIELQGPQHYYNFYYKPVHEFHRQLHHDWLKRKYARKNNIKLLTISFKEYDNFNSILDKELDGKVYKTESA